MSQSKRILCFDVLRALAMIAGVFFHGALPYMTTQSEWAIFDIKTSPLFDIFAWSLHRVRIPIFFLISGYLSLSSYEKKGAKHYFSIRFKKIFFPFVMAYLIIVPVIKSIAFSISKDGCLTDKLACLTEMNWPYTLSNVLANETLHLWFLYYLFIYQILFHFFHMFGLHKFSFRQKNISLVFILLVVQCLMTTWTSINSSFSLVIDPVSFIYYGVYFFAGTTLHDIDIEKLFLGQLRWRTVLVSLALLIVTPLLFLYRKTYPDSIWISSLTPIVSFCSIIFSLNTIGLLFGLTLKYCKRMPKQLLYLLDSSYWIYLWHIIPLILLQVLVNDSDYFILAKYFFVTLTSLIILLVFYHYSVRYTFIGTFLHGKRNSNS